MWIPVLQITIKVGKVMLFNFWLPLEVAKRVKKGLLFLGRS